MKKSLMLFFLGCAFLTHCAKKKVQDVQPDNGFPNTIGNTFTYAVTDSVSNKTYNVNVAVVGKTTLPNGKPVTIWTYTYPDRIDTSYVFSHQDSVVFYDKSKIYIINSYQFPLIVGAKWKVSFYTSTVVNDNTISVNGKTYDNVYLIHEHYFITNVIITRDQWLDPNIGLIKMHYVESDFGNVQQTWELISYQIN